MTITDLDFAVLYWIQEHLRCDFLDQIMPFITHLGSAGLIWICITLIFLCMKKYRHCGILLTAGLLAGLIVTNILLKNLVARERPCWIDPDIAMLIAVPQDFSFPSGHTTSSVIAAMLIFHEYRKLGIIAWILALLIIFSRMYLFVHFPTDILCGGIIGVIIAILIPRLIQNKQTQIKPA